MLDVIVTVSDSTPSAWVKQSIASVHEAINQCKFPVTFHRVPGVPGNIGTAMKNGLAECSNPWVSWVDDDDWVTPDAFTCLEKHFGTDADAICAREVHVLANGRTRKVDRRHHLTAYRRSAILGVDLDQYPAHPNTMLMTVTPNVVHEMSWVYMYRIRRSPGLTLRGKPNQAERKMLEKFWS